MGCALPFEKVSGWVNNLAAWRADDRDAWVRVGQAIHTVDAGPAGFELWDAFSRQSHKYKPGECERLWRGFVASKGRVVGAGTLSWMATQDGGLNAHSAAQTVFLPSAKPASTPPPKPRKLWGDDPLAAKATFDALLLAWQHPASREVLERDYGLTQEVPLCKYFEHPAYGPGIVYEGRHWPETTSVFKYKSLARNQHGKRRVEYLHGTGGYVWWPVADSHDLVFVCGEEKFMAAHEAGFNVLALLTGEHVPLQDILDGIVANAQLQGGRFICANDHDEAGRKCNEQTAQAVQATRLPLEQIAIVQWPQQAPAGYDLNDHLKLHGVAGLQQLLNDAPTLAKPVTMFTMWNAETLFEYQDDPRDVLLGDGLVELGNCTLVVGQPDIGKSRIMTQLAFDILLGRPQWLESIPIHRHDLNICILQTENKARRLKIDIGAQLAGCSAEQRRSVNQRLHFLVPMQLHDLTMHLNDEAVRLRMVNTLAAFKPDLLIIDPYGDIFAGENENDAVQTRETMERLREVTLQAGLPKVATILIHHAKSGRNAASEALGWDAQAFARGSKALMSIARAQLNIAQADEESKRILIACGKNNNGPKFDPFAVYLDGDCLRYKLDPTWEPEDFKQAVRESGGARRPLRHKPDQVVAALTIAGRNLRFGELCAHLMDDQGCVRSTAARLIRDAKDKGLIIEAAGFYSPIKGQS
jgi:hypothetical protein